MNVTNVKKMTSKKQTPIPHNKCAQNQYEKVMHQFKHHTLKTHGKVVTDRKQALAIGASDAKKKC